MSKSFGKAVISAIYKKSPAIMIGLGLAGMATTVFLAIKNTPRAVKHIEAKRDEVNKQEFDELVEQLGHEPEEYPGCRDLTVKEKIFVTWKDYALPAAIFTASTALILFANGMLYSKITTLGTAYKITEMAYKEYEDKVKETIGEKKNNAIKDSIAMDKVRACPLSPEDIIETGNGKTICFDPFSGRYFRTDIAVVERAYMKISTILNTEDCVDLNTFYDQLDLERIKLGDSVGWSINAVLRHTGSREIKPKFTSMLYNDDTPVLVIGFEMPPKYDWNWD